LYHKDHFVGEKYEDCEQNVNATLITFGIRARLSFATGRDGAFLTSPAALLERYALEHVGDFLARVDGRLQ
jgi:hypothetical protein